MGKKEGKTHRLLEPAPAADAAAPNPFARALGSTDFHTREAGLAALAALLARRPDLPDLEALKLWRGLFYAYWHADKAPVQAALAQRLADIMGQLPEQAAWQYYASCVRTVRREWAGIDHLRLDKFLALARRFTAAQLAQLQANAWQARRVARVAAFWRDEVLLPGDGLAAAGLAYHLADTLLPELAGCVGQGGGGGRGGVPDDATLRALLDPFCAALAAADSPAMLHRLRQGLFDPLLAELRQPGEAAPLRGLDTAALAAHLFELGAKPETRARNRALLYELSEALERAAAKRQRRQGQQPEQEARPQRRKGSEAEPATQPQPPAKQQAAQQAQQAQQQQQQADLTPASGKKAKKQRQSEGGATPVQERPQQQQQTVAAAAAAPSPAAPTPATAKKKGKKSRLGPGAEAGDGTPVPTPAGASREISAQEQQLLAAAVAAVTGGGGATPGAGGARRKAVRFSLKRNLVNVIGQPPKPAEVRTPPTAKPKGPALKKESAFGGPASAPERLLTRTGAQRLAQFQEYMHGRGLGAAPGSASRAEQPVCAPPGSGKKAKQRRRASTGSAGPGTFSRPRASEFF